MYAGKEINIGGEKYTLPPISMGQLRNGLKDKFKAHDEAVKSGDYWEFMTLRGEIIFSAFQRNYPNFDEKTFYDWLDIGNIGDSWLYVMAASLPLAPAAKETETETPGISDPSTNLSPQLTDGPIEK
jgi:hypothetical protein